MTKETQYYQIFNIKKMYSCFFNIKYLEKNYNYIHFELEYEINFSQNQNIY